MGSFKDEKRRTGGRRAEGKDWESFGVGRALSAEVKERETEKQKGARCAQGGKESHTRNSNGAPSMSRVSSWRVREAERCKSHTHASCARFSLNEGPRNI